MRPELLMALLRPSPSQAAENAALVAERVLWIEYERLARKIYREEREHAWAIDLGGEG